VKELRVWDGGRVFELRKMTARHIRKCLFEARGLLGGYGVRKDGGRAFTKTYSDELCQAERCVEVFEAELSRRALLIRARKESEKSLRPKSLG